MRRNDRNGIPSLGGLRPSVGLHRHGMVEPALNHGAGRAEAEAREADSVCVEEREDHSTHGSPHRVSSYRDSVWPYGGCVWPSGASVRTYGPSVRPCRPSVWPYGSSVWPSADSVWPYRRSVSAYGWSVSISSARNPPRHERKISARFPNSPPDS